jgi:hypothetical protein
LKAPSTLPIDDDTDDLDDDLSDEATEAARMKMVRPNHLEMPHPRKRRKELLETIVVHENLKTRTRKSQKPRRLTTKRKEKARIDENDQSADDDHELDGQKNSLATRPTK